MGRPATEPARAEAVSDERRFVIYGVPWEAYVAFRDALDDRSGVRMTYREGTLELMSPSARHEEIKKLLARLVEAFADARDVDLRGFGGATFRREARKRGCEPDECYTLGPLERGAPDIAIEVVVTNPLVDKLDVYAGLEVPEVWVWRDERVRVLRLTGERYEERARSEVVPGLDLELLARFVRPGESHVALARAYREALDA